MGTDFIKLDEMQEYLSLAAGAGNFNRIAFEYSPEISSNIGDGKSEAKAVVKFISPKAGVYKYTFQCKMNSTGISGIIKKQFAAPTSASKYYTSKTTYGIAAYNNLDTFNSSYIGMNNGGLYFHSSLDTSLYSEVINPYIRQGASNFTEYTLYFPAYEGEPIILYYVPWISDMSKSDAFTVRNQKITY